MGRNSKRSVASMFSNAIAAHEGETVSQLKEELERLKSQAGNSHEISVENIMPLQLPGEMKQPRLYFDPLKMERLKDSISKHGVLEPILVRPREDGLFEVVSGERRWRCCCSVGKLTIPCVVRPMTDSVALEAALIAHLLNEEISSIEQTESILGLLSLQLDLPLEEVKVSLYQYKNSLSRGKAENSRILSGEQLELIDQILNEFGMKLSSFVSNRLPMLNLEPSILDAVRRGELSPTNAVLINRQDPKLHDTLLSKASNLTKTELLEVIRSTARPKRETPGERHISETVFERFKSVRKKTASLKSPKVMTRLKKIDALLEEIEALCG